MKSTPTRIGGQSFLQGALILSAGILLVKILGAVYKIPLTNMIGEVGMGYFNTAYQLYLPVYTLATAGFPVAVSRMVSEYTAQGKISEARGVYRRARTFFLCSGLIGMGAMLAGAGWYARLTGSSGAAWCIRTLSPTVLLCCMMSALRGYYNGLRNMVPTAVSQVWEAVGRLFLGLGAAWGVLEAARRSYETTGTVFGQQVYSRTEALSAALPYGAAGATLGVTAGALCSLMYLWIYDRRHTPPTLARSPASVSTGQMAAVALPICAGALILNLGSMLDAVMMQQRLMVLPEKVQASLLGDRWETLQPGERIPFLYGSFTMAQNLAMLIPAFAQAMGTSALPNIAAEAAAGKWKQVRSGMEDVLFWTGAAAFPAGVGLAVLARPVLETLYAARPAGAQLAVRPLTVLALASIGMTLSVPVNSMLQALGKERIPMVLLVLGVGVKAAANYRWIADPAWNLTGGAVGSLLCYGIVTLLGLWMLKKSTPVKPCLVRSLWAPALAAGLCGAAAWAVRAYTQSLPPMVQTGCAIMGGGSVYVAVLLLCSRKKIRKWLANRRRIR